MIRVLFTLLVLVLFATDAHAGLRAKRAARKAQGCSSAAVSAFQPAPTPSAANVPQTASSTAGTSCGIGGTCSSSMGRRKLFNR